MSKAQFQRNQAIEQLIKTRKEKGQPFSRADIATINQFTGYGGLAKFGAKGKGLLSEYFTPIPVVEKMVGLAYQYGYENGSVLEPSCGIGRFLHYFAPDTILDAFEINPIAFQIASINFPSFNIQNQYFNQVFVDRSSKTLNFKAKYQLIIGNPPYGDFTGKYSTKERQLTKATRYESYFITRGLDLLLPDGLLVFIVPSSFLEGKQTKVKKQIAAKSELLDAYRLPKSIFQQTDIQTDIIVLQKKKT